MPTFEEIKARVNELPEDVRKTLHEVGVQIGSDNSDAQAEYTLNAHQEHGATVGPYGFDDEDARELKWLLDALRVMRGGRRDKQLDKKTTHLELRQHVRRAKAAKQGLKALLGRALRKARRQRQTDVAHQITAVLASAGPVGDDARKLANQLIDLAAPLADAPAAVAARTLAEQIHTLVSARIRPAGTPEETWLIDILDGMIVELVREARAAARAAARDLENPALEKAYALTRLYS